MSTGHPSPAYCVHEQLAKWKRLQSTQRALVSWLQWWRKLFAVCTKIKLGHTGDSLHQLVDRFKRQTQTQLSNKPGGQAPFLVPTRVIIHFTWHYLCIGKPTRGNEWQSNYDSSNISNQSAKLILAIWKLSKSPDATVVELDTSRSFLVSFNSPRTTTLLLARKMLTLTVRSAPRRTVFGANTRYDLHATNIHLHELVITLTITIIYHFLS